ncbi:MAG TPA: DUF4258 domain-containing protein [bacterium]|nr:DUF4258 domain-containing protein [bacterium]
MTRIQSIRQRITDRDYYLSSHAEDEMLADDIDREDIEHAIQRGRIEKRLIRDPRGARYRIEGPAVDGRLMHVICRFHVDHSLIIITAYVLEE